MRAKGEVTDVTALPRWNDSDPELVPNEDHAQAEGREARFPYAPDINAKVVLWCGGPAASMRRGAACSGRN